MEEASGGREVGPSACLRACRRRWGGREAPSGCEDSGVMTCCGSSVLVVVVEDSLALARHLSMTLSRQPEWRKSRLGIKKAAPDLWKGAAVWGARWTEVVVSHRREVGCEALESRDVRERVS